PRHAGCIDCGARMEETRDTQPHVEPHPDMLTVRGRVKTLDGSVNRFGDPVVIYYIRCGCMQKHMPDPQSFVPLTPAIAHILLALAVQARHGYGIMQEVERLTDGAARMGPGTLYGTIKRMIASGLLEEADERRDPEIDDTRAL